MIVVEYSRDMYEKAKRLGGGLEHAGWRVEYRRAGGFGVLRFIVNGRTYNWSEYDLMVKYTLARMKNATRAGGTR